MFGSWKLTVSTWVIIGTMATEDKTFNFISNNSRMFHVIFLDNSMKYAFSILRDICLEYITHNFSLKFLDFEVMIRIKNLFISHILNSPCILTVSSDEMWGYCGTSTFFARLRLYFCQQSNYSEVSQWACELKIPIACHYFVVLIVRMD